jgi:tRNA pseudouridine38-40 synthase
MRYRAALSYDGAAYQGFQRQAGDTPTIQLAVEDAIARVTQQRVTVVGAGRTDTGVHASGQVIAFNVEWKHDLKALLRALNSVLPVDIALHNIAEAPPDFHPRFRAIARQYRYTVIVAEQRQPLLRHRTWQLREPITIEVMHTAAGILTGTHDFGAFGKSPDGGHTIRTVEKTSWQVRTSGAVTVYEFEVIANAFLQHMVRRMVGSLVDVGRGRLTQEQFEDAFRRADPSVFKTLAPPQGLVLEAVFYPEDKLVK